MTVPNMKVLVNCPIVDWELHVSGDVSDIPLHRHSKYNLLVEQHEETKQLFISICDDNAAKHPELSRDGLNLIVEVQNGLPTLSAGICPDANLIHIFSNTRNKMGIVFENDHPDTQHGPIDFIDPQHEGICLTTPNDMEFEDRRSFFASKAFEEHDFGTDTIKDHSGWATDENQYVKSVFIESTGPSILKHFKVNFKNDSTHILSCELV